MDLLTHALVACSYASDLRFGLHSQCECRPLTIRNLTKSLLQSTTVVVTFTTNVSNRTSCPKLRNFMSSYSNTHRQ